jgi:hypothetical protein
MRSLKSELAKLSPPLAFQVRETHAPSSHSGCYFTALEAMHESGTTPLSAASRLAIWQLWRRWCKLAQRLYQGI